MNEREIALEIMDKVSLENKLHSENIKSLSQVASIEELLKQLEEENARHAIEMNGFREFADAELLEKYNIYLHF